MNKAQKYIKNGMEQYMAALHFNGLNKVFYHDLKQEFHNEWIVHSTDMTPKSIK